MPTFLLEIILLLVMVYSHIEMVCYIHSRRSGVPHDSILSCYDSFSIFEYMETTREDRGRIGTWFWVFVVAVLMMVFIAVRVVTGSNETGINVMRIDPDSFWPFL